MNIITLIHVLNGIIIVRCSLCKKSFYSHLGYTSNRIISWLRAKAAPKMGVLRIQIH